VLYVLTQSVQRLSTTRSTALLQKLSGCSVPIKGSIGYRNDLDMFSRLFFKCVMGIGATTLWDPWDASPPTFKDVGTKIWPPTFTSGCFCCTRLIVTNDQTNVFNCSLLLNTAVSRRLVTITSGEEECQCLATWQHARAAPVKLLLPMHYVAKMNLTFPTLWSLPTFKTWLRL